MKEHVGSCENKEEFDDSEDWEADACQRPNTRLVKVTCGDKDSDSCSTNNHDNVMFIVPGCWGLIYAPCHAPVT